MELSRTVQYALAATLRLGEKAPLGATSCSELAEVGHMPERFLLQILRCLVTHGILASSRGVRGGYVLARPLSSISLLDLIEAVEGPLQRVVLYYPFLSSESESRLTSAIEAARSELRHPLADLKLSALKLSSLPLTADSRAINEMCGRSIQLPHQFPKN